MPASQAGRRRFESGRPHQLSGGPRNGPPHPPTLVAPRMNRGAPRLYWPLTGPRNGPPHPPTLVAPRMNRGARRLYWPLTGPRNGPPPPPTLVAPRMNRGAPRSDGIRLLGDGFEAGEQGGGVVAAAAGVGGRPKPRACRAWILRVADDRGELFVRDR